MRPVNDTSCRVFRKWSVSLLFFFVSSAAAYSNIFNVTNTTDGNASDQLRGAIAAAVAAGAGPHTINVSAGTYNLTLGQISFGTAAITIQIVGASAATTIINMTTTMQDRIFFINPTGTIANVHVTIQNLTFTGGHLRSDNFGGGAILAGGPSNSLSISNCTFTGNTIDPSKGQDGGAVSMDGGGDLTVDQCTFVGNTSPTGNGGAINYFLPNNRSGSLTITRSVFTANTVTATNSDGGAIFASIQATLGTTTSSVTIESNSFVGNHADASLGTGGAIAINNGFSAANTALIDFNRFVSNTAANTPSTSALAMVSANGNVNANVNWWSCNEGPAGGSGCQKAAITGSGGTGVLQLTTWLRLVTIASPQNICTGNTGNTTSVTATFKSSTGASVPAAQLIAFAGALVNFSSSLGSISNAQPTIQGDGTATATFTSNGTQGAATVNSVVDNVPASDLVARASIAVNSSPVINTQPMPLTGCPGNEADFTVSASGSSLTYAWFKNTTQLLDGTSLSGSIIAGSNTSTLAIRNSSASDNSTAYNVLVTGANGCSSRSGNTQLTVAPLVIPGSNSGGLRDINPNDFAVNDGGCNRIALVQPSGMSPITGVVNASVTIDAGQPFHNSQPYVKRHYDIAPSTNPNTATATITLYFLQSEFDSYNAATPGTATDLPTNPGDATGRSNVRVTQYHGFGTNPGNYTGWGGVGPASILINPGGGNVIWNSTNNWWEVTFPVTGFSGFFITGLISNPLPVILQQITATKEQGGVFVQWEVGREVNFSHYEVETSTDGRSYSSIGIVTATNSATYSFLHNNPANGINYYRLKMVDIDGTSTYSRIVSCLFSVDDYSVLVMNNPFRQVLNIRIDAKENTKMQLQLTDHTGKLLLNKSVSVNKGANTIALPANVPANGIYLLRVSGGGFTKTLKVLEAH